MLADPGATVATAVNLGNLSTTRQTASDRLQSGDVDLFRFNLPSDSTLSAGDEQLEYRDNYYTGSTFNLNGEPLAGGTYFLQLAPSNSTTNTPYTLTISATAIPNSQDAGGNTGTARNFGTLTTAQQAVNDIAQWGDTDVYKFTLSTDSTLSATFSGLSELVQARLYRDLNNDGVLAGDEQLESRDNYYSGATFNFNGEPLMKGTYFLQVSPWNSEINTAYTLAISAASIAGSQDAGGTAATARDFGTLTTAVQTVND
ncbi:MAG: hypothetical protein NT069_12130, partial [Planctomycetota bacterium]|nr:hypothetical protein [Planctomycetota bacterium]